MVYSRNSPLFMTRDDREECSSMSSIYDSRYMFSGLKDRATEYLPDDDEFKI